MPAGHRSPAPSDSRQSHDSCDDDSISVGWAHRPTTSPSPVIALQNGTPTGLTAATSGTFSGLACGTSYTVAVDAYDAAGNRSRAPVIASTSACAPPPPAPAPTAPTGLP